MKRRNGLDLQFVAELGLLGTLTCGVVELLEELLLHVGDLGGYLDPHADEHVTADGGVVDLRKSLRGDPQDRTDLGSCRDLQCDRLAVEGIDEGDAVSRVHT